MNRERVLEDVGSSGGGGSSGSKNVSFRDDVGDASPSAQGTVHYCPIHNRPRLQGVWESSVEEDDDVEELGVDLTDAHDVHDARDPSQQIYEVMSTIYTNRDHDRLGLAAFIPRKLSTISSRSCSVNHPDDAVDVVDVEAPSQPLEVVSIETETPSMGPDDDDVPDALPLDVIDESEEVRSDTDADAEERRRLAESKPLLN